MPARPSIQPADNREQGKMRFRSSRFMGVISICAVLGSAHANAVAAGAQLDSPEAVLASLHAKITCSNRFIAGIDARRTAAEDLRGFGEAETVVDVERRSVTARIGAASETSVFSPGTGCTAVVGTTPDALRTRNVALAAQLKALHYADAPLATMEDATGIDYRQLNSALDAAFRETGDGERKNTRAIVVMHDGKIIAERYAPGVTVDTPLSGFSMTKSVLSVVIGSLVEKRVLKGVTERVGLSQWRKPGDRRANITYDDLMRMTTGLAWNEDYADPMSDALVTLFGSYDSSSLAATRTTYMPGERYYNYSSGDTQILSAAIRELLTRAGLDAQLYPYQALFAPLGMKSAQLEMDAAGNPLYAAFLYASARDWARLGQFLLAGGRIGERQLLPDGWVRYATTPTAESDSQQGALFAVNAGEYPMWPSLPTDTYAALGIRGQRLLVIPSKSLVVVRLGASVPESAWNVEEFAAQILRAVGGADTTAARAR
ncbi:serine hydrolase domain-containing protein [Burkholderia ubonensis]|nr:serine hydrolase [Burkholderia ubonensis]